MKRLKATGSGRRDGRAALTRAVPGESRGDRRGGAGVGRLFGLGGGAPVGRRGGTAVASAPGGVRGGGWRGLVRRGGGDGDDAVSRRLGGGAAGWLCVFLVLLGLVTCASCQTMWLGNYYAYANQQIADLIKLYGSYEKIPKQYLPPVDGKAAPSLELALRNAYDRGEETGMADAAEYQKTAQREMAAAQVELAAAQKELEAAQKELEAAQRQLERERDAMLDVAIRQVGLLTSSIVGNFSPKENLIGFHVYLSTTIYLTNSDNKGQLVLDERRDILSGSGLTQRTIWIEKGTPGTVKSITTSGGIPHGSLEIDFGPADFGDGTRVTLPLLPFKVDLGSAWPSSAADDKIYFLTLKKEDKVVLNKGDGAELNTTTYTINWDGDTIPYLFIKIKAGVDDTRSAQAVGNQAADYTTSPAPLR